MKLVTAVARPEKLEEVTNAVTDAGARGLTAPETRGSGQQYGHVSRGSGPSRPALLPKIRVDVAVREEYADAVVGAIAKCANTGMIGDGKTWVTVLDSAMRVRPANVTPLAV